jgi:hypothetical protein
MNYKQFAGVIITCLFFSFAGIAQSTNFSKASVFLPEKKNILLQKAVQVLQEEIQKRTNLSLPLINKSAPEGKQMIIVGVEGRMEQLTGACKAALNNLSQTGKDGYKIALIDNNTLIIAGYDERGTLYGVGKLLQKMELQEGKILIPGNITTSSTLLFIPSAGIRWDIVPKPTLMMPGVLLNTTAISVTLQSLAPTASRLCHQEPMMMSQVYT